MHSLHRSIRVVIYIFLHSIFSAGDWQQVVDVFSSRSGDRQSFFFLGIGASSVHCRSPASPLLPVSKWRNYNRDG